MLCVAVMLSVMVMGAGAAFSDQDKIENKEAVDMCAALNIIGGYPDGSYKPEGNIKRSEICKMICVALNGGEEPTLGTPATPTFSDVRTSENVGVAGVPRVGSSPPFRATQIILQISDRLMFPSGL